MFISFHRMSPFNTPLFWPCKSPFCCCLLWVWRSRSVWICLPLLPHTLSSRPAELWPHWSMEALVACCDPAGVQWPSLLTIHNKSRLKLQTLLVYLSYNILEMLVSVCMAPSRTGRPNIDPPIFCVCMFVCTCVLFFLSATPQTIGPQYFPGY